VIFEGFLMSHIYYDETFNILEVNKDAGVIMINSTEAVCNVFDWTKGQVKVANGGIFTADDLADDGIFADFDLQSGSTVNLHQDIYQRVDFGGQLAIADGSTVNVHGGNGWSQWPYGADATLYMTDGTLDFKDQGINVNALSPNTLTLDLTGGIIRTPVGFFCNRPDFDPEPATLEIYGIGNSSIDLQSGQLWNININKSGTEDEVLINSDLTANSVVVNSGVLKSTPNSNLIFKNAYAYDNGTIWLTQGTDIKIKSSNEFAANGGNFKFMGEPDNYVSIGKHGTNLINLYVGNGGNISARYTHFSDLTGALIMNDGIVNPDHAFTGCIFENGFYCLMQIDNNQDLTIQDAHFPTASAPYNAAKYSDQGSVTFINATGAFAGEAFEDDPHNRIHWIVPQPGLWTGAVSTDWFTAGNWDDGNVPATSTNVTIPAGCPNYPVISGAAAVCDDMDINTGASLTVGNNTLTAGGDVYIYGLLTMTNASAVMDAYRIYWMAGSSDNVTAGTFHVHNWYFYDGTNAKLGTGNTVYVYSIGWPQDADAEFGNLVAVTGSKLMGSDNKAYYPLRVAGNFTVQTSVNWSNFGVDLIVAGNSVIQNGGNLAFVSGADYYNAGTMDLAGTIYLSSGSVITCNGELTFPSTGYLNLGSDGQFLCNYNDASSWTYLNGRINMSGTSVFEMSQKSILISSTFNDNDLTGGTLRFGRSLSATNAGNFQLTGVLTEFISGNSGHYVNVVNGNYLHDMRVNKPSGTIQVIDNLIVKNNMVIDAGAITVSDKVITIGGNWTNNVGTSGFVEGTSRVIFNGSTPQFCSTEEFYILEIDKTLHYFYDQSESNIFCQIYDWTQGGMWIAGGSSFHAADLADDGIYGDFVLWWNSIELHQDALQSIDLHGSISVNGGEFRVYGGNDQSLWGTNANASLYMGDGVLDFVDQGIKIQDAAPYSFTSDISGGTIRTQKGFIVQSPGFNPMGGTVELYGAQNSAILSTEGGAFYNVTINKPSDFSTRVSIWPSVVKNNFVVAEGLAEVGFGHELECWNNLEVQDGGWMAVNSGTLSMKYLSSVNVNNNGLLSLFGYEGAMSRVKGIVPTKQYTFSINDGGNLEATFSIFEDLPEQGVYIAPGATVNPSYSFTNCEFRNGMSGPTTLLSIENDQDIIIENAVFPTNTWGGQYNVRKLVDAGSVTFVNATGGFAGEAFENDPYNRIFWNNVPVNYDVNGLTIGTGVSICFNAQQTITVSDFSIDNGGSATFIAGNNIRFLPETWIKPGGYMHAYITTTEEYCGNMSASMVSVAPGDEDLKLLPEQEPQQQRCSIYPNPTTGNFTILHEGDILPGNVQVEIFNMHGESIFSTFYTDEKSHRVTLSGLPAGLCFVKVRMGDHVESIKLVITR